MPLKFLADRPRGSSFRQPLLFTQLYLAVITYGLGCQAAFAERAAPASAWAACYGGIQAGAATSSAPWTYTNSNAYSSTGNADPQLVGGASFNDRRAIAGLQIGCNLAVAPSWLIGIEGSWFTNPMNNQNYNGNFIPFPQDPNFNYREVITTNIQSVYSLTGRVGASPAADWLIYGKGGLAAARVHTAGRVSPAFDPAVFDFATTAWHGGWTAGVGVEYRLFRNVTIGAEYNYFSFGSVVHSGRISALDFDINGVASPASPINHRVKPTVQTLMARVNFGFGDPSEASSGPYAAYAAYLKAPPAAVDYSYAAFTSSEVKYTSWTGSRGSNVFDPSRGSGYQVYSPTTVGLDYVRPSEFKFETRMKGGYVYSRHNTPGQWATYEGPVDTQTAFNLTLLNFDNVRPLLGLSMNLPTGNSYLPGNQRFTRMDPDLVPVGSYGAGFNVNPTAGFIIGLNQTTALSLSAGYAFQGAFTKEGISQGLTPDGIFRLDRFDLQNRVDPGDTFTANGNVSSTFGNLVLIGSFAYMADSRVVIDGVSGGRSGARFTSNGSANYRFDDRWALAVNVSWNFAEKNKIVDPLAGFITEPKNSNSHLIIASVDPSYRVTENLRIGVNYSYLYRNENYYDQIQDQFIPAKQKHLIGASATVGLTPRASLTFRGSHSWIKQEDSAYLLATAAPPPPAFAFQPPALKYESWAASVAANLNF